MGKYICTVATEFSRFPGGRLREGGPKSGEEFKEQFILPLLQEHEFITFDLSGSAGYSTGWLDEAFGFLGAHMPLDEIERRLSFTAEDDPEALEILWQRIHEASKE